MQRIAETFKSFIPLSAMLTLLIALWNRDGQQTVKTTPGSSPETAIDLRSSVSPAACRGIAHIHAQELISAGKLSTKPVFYKCSSGNETLIFDCVNNLTNQAICGEKPEPSQ